jgi:pSer/pThr/pTyr-binding forkhead associated (FHA) protein
MPRLLINPGTPSTWEIQLRPGSNSLGRGAANDFQINHPSVSGSHCQIVLENGTALLRDLGSTNGTFINRAPVKEAALQAGQTIHLGGVEIVYQGDGPASATVTEAQALPPPPVPVPHAIRIAPSGPPPPRAISVTPSTPPPIASGHATAISVTPSAPAAVPTTATGSGKCKFHPKTAGRYHCNKCHLFYCELCITSRPSATGPAKKFCRQCGTEVTPVKVQVDRADKVSFFSRLPKAFIYPALGSGVFVLIVCTIVTFGLRFISAGLFSIFAKMAFYGYMFSFMQNIIHSTASGDNEMPGWPSFDDLGGCFIRFAAAAVISFGVPITLSIMAIFSDEPGIGSTLLMPSWVFGSLYFPMALLAVAMKDSPLAVNPLVVLPAIFKAPLEYIVTVILMGIILALYNSGDSLIGAIFPRGLTTHNMAKMFGFLAAWAFWFFFQLYLLAVNMRILGLLYISKKRKFGWFEH